MKQTALTLASLLSATLGFSESQAAIVAGDILNDNAADNFSVKQQKAIFAFSRDRASLTMTLIERWSGASQSERQALMAEFVDAFFAAANKDRAADGIISEIGLSVLMADTLGNAKSLLVEKGILSPDALNRAVEEVKASLMRVCYESRGQVIVPYIPQKLAWGQHGASERNLRRQRGLERKPPTPPKPPMTTKKPTTRR